ncbi:glyoxalase-like protein [Nitzschia inconspicua]|uniref:Glyoxalase-like protein n=1 Tax=Nitzschia inconspicua TaxID=303405 RepID=A0A9K3K6R3_9STRA|nr:glyoxalase-like protein [Nitzschia inconspicua]
MTGLKPTKIGALRGAGSKSARVRLDKNTFVEIIGPDDKNPSEGMGPTLSAMPKGKLVPFHYAIRQEKEKVVIPESENWDRDEVVMVHADPDAFDESGEVAKWDFLLLYKHGIGGAVPAFVNWRETSSTQLADCQKHPEGSATSKFKLPADIMFTSCWTELRVSLSTMESRSSLCPSILLVVRLPFRPRTQRAL